MATKPARQHPPSVLDGIGPSAKRAGGRGGTRRSRRDFSRLTPLSAVDARNARRTSESRRQEQEGAAKTKTKKEVSLKKAADCQRLWIPAGAGFTWPRLADACVAFGRGRSALFAMKVLCANEGLMSNFELLEVLRQRTRETPVALLPHVHDPFPTEMQCSDTLKKTPAGAQTKENLAKFIKAVEPFNLTPAECLNLINSKPTTDVEIHLLVEDCEKRLKESEVEHLLKLSADLL